MLFASTPCLVTVLIEWFVLEERSSVEDHIDFSVVYHPFICPFQKPVQMPLYIYIWVVIDLFLNAWDLLCYLKTLKMMFTK